MRMMKMITFFAVTLCGLVSGAHATVTVWTVQSASSSLTLSGGLSSAGTFYSDLKEQDFSGQPFTSYSGTITTQQSPTAIEFLSAVLAANTSGNWDPLPGGGTGSAAADYGFLYDPGFLGGINSSIRDLVIDVSSNPATLSGSPASLQTFSATLQSTIVSGVLDYRGYGVISMFGYGTNNDLVGDSFVSSSAGSIELDWIPGTAVLIVPIELEFASIYLGADTTDTSDDVGTYMSLFGTIVATAPAESVPEASSLALLGVAGSVVGFAGYRRKRKSQLARS